MDATKVDSGTSSKLVGIVVAGAIIAAGAYFGLPHYTKYKAKQDLEKIGITFSEQKFVEKACDADDGSVALFIQAGMNINVLAVPPSDDRIAKSVLHCAASTGNVSLAKSLLDLGADVNIKDDASNTPLYSASGRIRYNNNRQNQLPNNLDVVKLLIEHGADINAGGVAGPPLMAAIQARSFEVFDYLLAKGANVKVKNKEEMTPLMLMAQSYNNNSKDAQVRINALLKAGAAVNDANMSGQTALMMAVNNRSKDMVRILLENGADPSVEDKNGSNILSYAISDPDMLRLFIEKGADPNVMVQGYPLLHQAAQRNDAALQILLANKKTDVNIKNNNGENVLHILARSANYAPKLGILIASAAMVNATNNQLETPLIKAVQARNIAAATIFLESKASVNARDASGRTALYYATQNTGRGAYGGYAYDAAPMAEAAPASAPAPMASSDMDIREIMRRNDTVALQRYLAEVRARNSSVSKYGRYQPKIPSDPMIDLLKKYGATM